MKAQGVAAALEAAYTHAQGLVTVACNLGPPLTVPEVWHLGQVLSTMYALLAHVDEQHWGCTGARGPWECPVHQLAGEGPHGTDRTDASGSKNRGLVSHHPRLRGA